MRTRTKVIGGIAAVAVSLGIGAGVAVATTAGDDGSGEPITGDALVRASETALAHAGGGRVTGTEVGDEESYYEVEVTLDDGTQIDVQLDEGFAVVSDKVDHEDSSDGAAD